MPRRLLKFAAKSLSREPVAHALTHTFSAEDIVWVMGSFCALNRKPFDAGLLLKQFPPPRIVRIPSSMQRVHWDSASSAAIAIATS